MEGLSRRQEINITQAAFANRLGETLDTERKWELDTIQPNDAAQTVAAHAAGYVPRG